MNGPYGSSAVGYWDAGWEHVLPLPPGRKGPPPADHTGWAARSPSYADVMAWTEDQGDGNVALHLPPGVIGLDVDNYGTKAGAESLASAERMWGPLPPTWCSTSRQDGISGIRLYRVPVGLRWPGGFGPGTETIHSGHRYAVVAPSTHPDTGRAYRWIDPQGTVSVTVPELASLPALPMPWVVGLTGGREAKVLTGAGLDDEQIRTWLHDASRGSAVCDRMAEAVADMLTAMPGAAHETLSGLMRVVGLAGGGHEGLMPALRSIRHAFLTEVTRPGREHQRSESEAAAEWSRSLFGAVDKVVGEREAEGVGPLEANGDPCRFGDPTTIERPLPVTGAGLVEPSESGVWTYGDEPGADEKAPPVPEDGGEQSGQSTAPGSMTAEQRHEVAVLAELRALRLREEAKRRLTAENAPVLRRLSAIEFRDSPRPESIVPGVFYRDSLARVYGAPGCGKSFLSLDLALHVALGRDWRGAPVERGRVFYVMAEGQAVNVLRVEAWCERNQVEFAELEGWFDAFPDALSLTEAALGAFVGECARDQPALVLLDTKNAMMVGEENSATDFAVMRRGLDAIRKASSACVVLIDHTGYEGTRARGTSAATAGMDTEMWVKKDEGSPALITAEMTRDKAAEAGKTWAWHLRMAADAAALVPNEDYDPDAEDDLRGDDGPQAWRDAVIPIELVNYAGDGSKSVADLARLMSHDASERHGDPAGIGMTRSEATRALREVGHSDTTVRRAWSFLISAGWLVAAEGVKAAHLRHLWAQ